MAISESIKFRLKPLRNGLRRDINGKHGECGAKPMMKHLVHLG